MYYINFDYEGKKYKYFSEDRKLYLYDDPNKVWIVFVQIDISLFLTYKYLILIPNSCSWCFGDSLILPYNNNPNIIISLVDIKELNEIKNIYNILE